MFISMLGITLVIMLLICLLFHMYDSIAIIIYLNLRRVPERLRQASPPLSRAAMFFEDICMCIYLSLSLSLYIYIYVCIVYIYIYIHIMYLILVYNICVHILYLEYLCGWRSGWRCLSSAACLTRPRLCSVFLLLSRAVPRTFSNIS